MGADEYLRNGFPLDERWLLVLGAVLFVGGSYFALRRSTRRVVGEVDAQIQAQRTAATSYLTGSGTPATAVVLYVDAGSTEPAFRAALGGLAPPDLSWWPVLIGLRVHAADGVSYNVQIEQHVEPDDLAALQLGATVEVRVDPVDPNNAMIDFTKPVMPPGVS